MNVSDLLKQSQVMTRAAPKTDVDIANRLFSLWAIKNLRPLKIGEDDTLVRFCEFVSNGRHRPPTRATVSLMAGVFQEEARNAAFEPFRHAVGGVALCGMYGPVVSDPYCPGWRTASLVIGR